MRRTVASGMARLGVGLHVVERILGHVSGATVGGIVSVYQRHSFEAEKREALQQWADYLAKL